MTEITLNGQRREVPGKWSVQDLILDLDLKGRQVAVELNGEIVKRSEWDKQQFSAGDQVEIVHFVGGGETQCRII